MLNDIDIGQSKKKDQFYSGNNTCYLNEGDICVFMQEHTKIQKY